MACNKDHSETDIIINELPINQGGFGRHKCASCAYEKGLENGINRNLNFNLEKFIQDLNESQKGLRRHRDPAEAYSLGFFHGLSGKDNHTVIRDKDKMAIQMRDFGLYMVAKGAVNATFSEMGVPYSHEMAIVHIAHGFEILIKSRIVEEHPLLIFNKIPKDTVIKDIRLEISDLLEHGQTIMYSELPQRLWATTGYKIDDIDLYNEFGKIRNQIIHFFIPATSLSDIALKFAFTVIEKAVNDWWDTSILEYAVDYDEEYYLYAFEQLERLNIQINYKLNSDKSYFEKK